MRSPRLQMILVSVLCVLFVLTTFQQFLGKQRESKIRGVTEKALKEAIQAKESVQKELDEQKGIRADLESQLTDTKGQFTNLQAQAEMLSAQLAEERKAKEDAVSSLSDKKRELENLRLSYDEVQKQNLSLGEQIDKLKKEYAALQNELTQIKAKNDSLAQQVQELQLRKEVELEKIVVKPHKGQEGKVLVVNKEFNFIVISAGNNKGITPGTPCEVYRDGSLIGRVQVEKVYETMSAANILPESAEIKEGDSVRVF